MSQLSMPVLNRPSQIPSGTIPPGTIRPSPIPLLAVRDEAVSGIRLHRDPGLIRVRHGVYADLDLWARLAPWERYLARVHAVKIVWTMPVFGYESAAALLGLPVFDEPRKVHLIDSGGESRRYGDVSVHSTIADVDVVSQESASVTSVAETAVALCRVLPPAFALATADAALRRLESIGDHAQLRERGHPGVPLRGVGQLRWVLERATPAAESVGESVSRAVIEWLGFDSPELQAAMRYEGHDDRVDFCWPGQRVIGESDGYGKYKMNGIDGVADQFIREKVREDRLRRHTNGFARWDWRDAMRAQPLDQKLRAAGLTAVRPANDALLATLATNPRSLPRAPFAPATR